MNNNTVSSYKNWLKATKNSSTLSNPYKDYLEYVNGWYDTTFNGKTTAELTADEYRDFLLTIKIVSNDPSINNFIDRLDYDNADEIQTAIPYFAKNLRDIARYISRKRDDAKNASIDYSYLGSNNGLERELYRSLLEVYISSTTLSNSEILSTIGGTSIEIEELYDDNEYHDKSPNLTATDYFDVDVNSEFYTDMTSAYMSWVIESGFNELYSNNDLFNPPVSGTLPISGYMDYTTESEQVTHYQGNLSTTIMGENHFYLSGEDGENALSMGDYSNAINPWDNLSNRYFPTIAMLPIVDSTYSKYEVGGFIIPSKLGMSVALGKNKFYNSSKLIIQGTKDNFPNPSIYSNGYSFSKEYQDSPIIYNAYLNWIDIKHVSGRGKGILSSNGKYQEMTPYQTSQETTTFPYLGMNQIDDNTDPWFGSEDKTWEDNVKFPSDFRKIYDIDGWYSHSISVTGVEDQWGIDIYGNNYATYKDISGSNLYDNRENSTGTILVRGIDGDTKTYEDFYADSLSGSLLGFGIDSVRRMDIFNDIVVIEDSTGAVMAQQITLDGGEYKAESNRIALTTNFESGEYSPFDYCYDDRTNTLYVARYLTVPVDGFFEFIIYKFEDGRFIEVYNTTDDTSVELLSLRKTFTFTDITLFPSISISPIDDKMFLTYIANVDDAYIVSIPFVMTGTFAIDEITVVQPASTLGTLTDEYAVESRKLIKTMISADKLTILLEGETTTNRYLQVIPL